MNILCKATRPSTGSTIEIEIPEDVVQRVDFNQDITLATQWIGEEFNWQFIPTSFENFTKMWKDED